MNKINDEIFERKLEEVFEQEEYKDICAVFSGEDEDFYKGIRFTLAYFKVKESEKDKEEIRNNAPDGATHYKYTMKGSVRYYTKDWNDSWGIYQDWKYPIGWKKVTNIFDETDLKSL